MKTRDDMNPGNRLRRAAHMAMRLAPWLVSITVTIVGLSLLLTRTTIVWEESQFEADMWDATPVDVTGIGLALLCVGILSLMATLLCEAHVRTRTITAPTRESGSSRRGS